MRNTLTLEMIKEAFTYDPDTGVVSWNENRPAHHFPTRRGHAQFLGRNAGKPAGSPNRDGHLYATFTHANGTRTAIPLHHIAWMLGHDTVLPVGKHVDHYDGQRTNNRLTNLRAVDPYINARNVARRNKPSTGYAGIYETPSGFEVRLTVERGGSQKKIGTYGTIEEALRARAEAAIPLGYTLRHLGIEDEFEELSVPLAA